MVRQVILAAVLSVLFSICSACVDPQVTSKSFTTQDATIVTHIAYISEFTVKCSSGKINSLYAELDDGSIIPVAIVGQDTYQVSWTEEAKSARKGDRAIRVFNEEGYTALRKAIRSGESTASVSPLLSITVNHYGAYNGPWVKSEFIAAVVSLFVSYVAFTTRSKIAA